MKVLDTPPKSALLSACAFLLFTPPRPEKALPQMSYAATAQSYAEWDTNPTTRPLHAGFATWDESTMKENFGGGLEFGTAGLRGPMGVGSTRMNEVTVMQAAQGVVSHLLASVPGAASQGVVIGYDHRGQVGLTSRRFALLTAAVCVAKGVKCYLFSQLVATPLVPFGILHLGAAAGVMVTASHNPKMDNGYKVYWGNGSQIISPVDKAIAAAIVANACPWAPYGPALDGGAGEAALLSHPLLSDPLDALLPAYLAGASKDLSLGATGRLPATTLPMHHRVTYTAMHGVGTPYTAAMFQAFKLPPFTPTPQQVQPDPNFSTVAVSVCVVVKSWHVLYWHTCFFFPRTHPHPPTKLPTTPPPPTFPTKVPQP